MTIRRELRLLWAEKRVLLTQRKVASFIEEKKNGEIVHVVEIQPRARVNKPNRRRVCIGASAVF